MAKHGSTLPDNLTEYPSPFMHSYRSIPLLPLLIIIIIIKKNKNKVIVWRWVGWGNLYCRGVNFV
ncbi:hypothetical protein BP00DRAFT_429873 [Aspergillus indologenus CBS 114.80]|uniref:Transmembrane protein n=1 Tax=Aspergillus indologenus CBS 114.80 TaxID=1450541 RepID=A0A2V5HSZ7_9EURO|nr:hypothetical protein BP00DRAFT_429873 [Aspergillus indologenus CBS 114.80]